MAPDALPDDLIDEAIAWSVKLRHGKPTPELQVAFARWLQADPVHAFAWQRVEALGVPFQQIPSGLVRRTLQSVDSLRRQRRKDRRSSLKLLSLAGMALGAGLVAKDNTPWQRLLADASTPVGQQKTMRLNDGTLLVLNTDSALSIDLAGAQRVLVLRRGEIQVTTGPDSEASARLGVKRPFWVVTPAGRMRAIGTRFTVRLDGPRALVSVQDGAVELHPSGRGSTAIVGAGQAHWLMDAGSVEAALLGLEPDAWVDGVIAGKDMRLEDLLAELSRYRVGHIACDARVAELRVSGLYQARNTDQVLQFLVQTQPVSVTYRTRFWVSVGPSAAR